MLKSHTLVPDVEFEHILYELRPVKDPAGRPVDRLHNAWISLNNPQQLNSYTTHAVKEIILAFRQASMDRSVVCVVFTAVGDQAFCTGGNTKEYAEYYTGNPQEYKQYMRLFNDMIDSILRCDKPVVNRVNGMRIAGGQEIGMACDFTIAADTARFGQAGPKHGSAPDGGSTDFLPLYVGFSRAMESGVLCEMWSAHKALAIGLIDQIVPVLKNDGRWIPNPMVVIDRYADEWGNIVFGDFKSGKEREAAKAIMAKAETDLSKLDEAVEALCTKILMLMPDCVSKTVNSLRKHKQWHWDNTSVTNREWLGLNMMTEAKAGFRAFNEGPKGKREVDFIKLRQLLAQGHPWDDELIHAISPQYQEGG
ncbi:MAG: 6-oxocyclohex-1-ene-1-carbonyl-CoA hydratase [Gemmatimonadota bacterium]|nr:6-oxocyclohex-1-ene-1-carbonyl-CoA hydratase [Gemmatimonadota bacterium]MDH3369345.1 6-oxocyclohex-1-ene-1-carbonyl-CoA hydratase [Gemmatimonadota bacterium]MDH3478769.1 6-oxocyclohex-1-ene-1-carbonyl-CoA hydratase [Gemmatimonadota bacterium]MDH3568832.1 6-oxocyclohex-1-ene-1-carbonyl-CoA hydratase [Gemmatimonadota bacterium]MDH5549872.1 6-oxocyclohex-1-ene-1-carbonyl-CoA hydratase [Gemmatimonadota bacterium]